MVGQLTSPRIAMLLVAVTAACRIGYDELSVADGGGGEDALPGLDAALELDEDITVPAGWTVSVWSDFSSVYTYDPDQYFDDPFTFSNRPHRLFVIPEPFEPGLGMVASWEIYELRPPEVIVHSYFQATAAGPDAMWDAEFCGLFGGSASSGICVAAGSQGGGDGIFRIEEDWSIANIDPIGNATELAYAPNGALDSAQVPTLYVGGPNAISELGGMSVFSGVINGGFVHVLRDGDLLASAGSPMRQLVRVKPAPDPPETLLTIDVSTVGEVARQNDGAIAIVTGGGAQIGGLAHIIVGGHRLLQVEESGGLIELASTANDGDWIWSHAVLPPASHPLGGASGAFYILEHNPVTEVDRVLRIGPP